MFREMRRNKQTVSKESCIKILQETKRGILAVNGDDGYPYALPIDYFYDEKTNTIYFHCAKVGHKIDALKNNPKACFTVMDEGFQKTGDWALNITSVIAFGEVAFINDPQSVYAILFQLASKYYPTKEEAYKEAEKYQNIAQILALHISQMTGKLVNEK